MTATRGTPPTLTLIDARDEIPRAERDDWVRRTRLVAWPSMREVPVEVSYLLPTISGERAHRLEFHPREPLGHGWYAVVVELDGSDRDIQAGLFAVGERGRAARFRPDSHPILLGARVENDGEGSLFEVELSERVILTDSARELSLRDDGRQIACETITRFVTAGGDEVEAQSRIAFRCPRLSGARLEIALLESVVTAIGTPVYGPDDRTPATAAWEVGAGSEGAGSDGHPRSIRFDLDAR